VGVVVDELQAPATNTATVRTLISLLRIYAPP